MSLLRAATYLTLLSLLSKALGFFREILAAKYFGASAPMDAFVVANTVYNITSAMFSDAMLAAALPLLVLKKTQDGDDAFRALTGTIFSANLIGSVLIVGAILLSSKYIIYALAPGVTATTAETSRMMLRDMGLYGIAVALVKSMTTFYNSERRFVIPSITSLAVNIVTISSILFLTGYLGIRSLSIGWSAGFAATAILLIFLSFKNYKLWGNLKESDLRKIVYSAMPLFVSLLLIQLNMVIDRFFASWLEAGSMSALNYAQRLIQFPLSIVLATVGTISFTVFSEKVAKAEIARLSELLNKALSFLSITVIPITVFVLFFSKDIVHVIFERGAFDRAATNNTSTALFFYILGLPAMAFSAPFVTLFRALRKNAILMLATAIGITINIILNILLVKHYGIAGLSFATSISFIFGFGFFISIALRKLPDLNLKTFKLSVLKSILAAFMAGLATYGLAGILKSTLIMHVAVVTVLFFVLYILVGIKLRLHEFLPQRIVDKMQLKTAKGL